MGSNAIRQQFADTMLAVGQEDPELVVLIGDISHFLLQPFAKACPGRFYNIGICEPTIISMAAGLAKVGFFPVVHTIAPFILDRSFEQLKLDFCYQGLGGTLITVGSAFDYANLGCTHHCYDDFARLKALPNTQVIYPASLLEFDALFRQTYRNGLLTLFRLPAHLHEQTFGREEIRVGKGLRVVEGANLTLIATGPQLRNAVAAQEPLREMGWDPEILYFHTLRPLDRELIRESVRKTGCVLVIEEHSWSGGLGDDVLRATHDLGGIQYASLSIPDAFVRDYGTYEGHCEALGLSRDGIVRTVASSFALKKEKEVMR